MKYKLGEVGNFKKSMFPGSNLRICSFFVPFLRIEKISLIHPIFIDVTLSNSHLSYITCTR